MGISDNWELSMSSSLPTDGWGAAKIQADGFLLFDISSDTGASVQDTVCAARRFFCLSAESKNANGLPYGCGYRPMGIEYSQSPDRPDIMETFTASARTATLAKDLPSLQARALHERMISVFDAFERIAESLCGELAALLSHQAPTARLNGAFHRWSRIQLNYSRPVDCPREVINDLHEDGHLLTLAYASGPGLELVLPTNAILPITPSDRTILAMPGKITWLMSGGAINPIYHRVRRDPRCLERFALLFFGDIDPKYCEPWIGNELNSGVDIGSHVRTNAARFGLTGFSDD
jgi:isopenicillin N synthase-like dioxygenase